MENYKYFYISRTRKKYHLFPTCGSMKESERVSPNDERLDYLSLCLKCEKKSESYFRTNEKSFTSLVDSLNDINVDSSFNNRKKIAEKNGISNYSGTAQQNLGLLSKLNEGKLMKPKKELNYSPISTNSSFTFSPLLNLSQFSSKPLYLSQSPSPSPQSLNQPRNEINKIQNSGQFGEKTKALVIIGNILYDNGYETAFIAGILANIKHEGNFGFFESSKYIKNPNKKPKYLKIMDGQYNYDKNYSGKYIYDLSLKELKEMCDKLKKDKWQKGKFGLGIIQWTGERTSTLVDFYLAEAKGADKISLDQVISAEGKMMIHELKSNSYKSIYDNWKKDNIKNLNSENAAFDAASKICIKYEIPAEKEKKANERGNTAKQIYKVMTG